VLAQRSDHTKHELTRAETLKRQTENVLVDYRQALSDARAKASTLARLERERLAAEVAREKARLEARIAAKLGEAESSIAESKSKALARADDIATELAGAIVTRLIGKEVTTDEARQAIMRPAAE
jgi:F-type H+-transporting ATPase subunit b